MTIKECYEKVGSDYDGVLKRLGSEALVKRFAVKFLNDPSFQELTDGLAAQDGEKAFRAAHTLKEMCIRDRGDTRIAVVGVFGKDALECAPTCELLFKDPVEAVKQTVTEIKKNENVDMIACVSCLLYTSGLHIQLTAFFVEIPHS